jgi:MFS family permease
LTLPFPLFGLLSGAVADRVDRRRAMVIVDTARGGVLAAVAVLVVLGRAGFVLLYVAFFVLATGETLFRTLAQAALPALVGRDDLARTNGWLVTGEVVGTEFVGPALGGLLFAVTAGLPFGLDALSFLGSALLIRLISAERLKPPTPTVPRTSSWDGVGDGLRWLIRQPVMRVLAIASLVINLVAGATMAVFVLYARSVLRLPTSKFGLLLALGAVGGVAGGLLAGRVSQRVGRRTLAVGLILLQAAGLLAVAVTADVAVTAAMLAVIGFTTSIWNVVSACLRQELTPPAIFGRVTSAYRMVAWSSLPVGAAVGGALAASLGLRSPFAIGGAVLAALAVVMACGRESGRP